MCDKARIATFEVRVVWDEGDDLCRVSVVATQPIPGGHEWTHEHTEDYWLRSAQPLDLEDALDDWWRSGVRAGAATGR